MIVESSFFLLVWMESLKFGWAFFFILDYRTCNSFFFSIKFIFHYFVTWRFKRHLQHHLRINSSMSSIKNIVLHFFSFSEIRKTTKHHTNFKKECEDRRHDIMQARKRLKTFINLIPEMGCFESVLQRHRHLLRAIAQNNNNGVSCDNATAQIHAVVSYFWVLTFQLLPCTLDVLLYVHKIN